MVETDEVNITSELQLLGFTRWEAEVFDTLLHIGSGSAPEIAQHCTVPRMKVHYVSRRLARLGHIKLIGLKPLEYSINPSLEKLKDIVSRKKAESEINEKTLKFIEDKLKKINLRLDLGKPIKGFKNVSHEMVKKYVQESTSVRAMFTERYLEKYPQFIFDIFHGYERYKQSYDEEIKTRTRSQLSLVLPMMEDNINIICNLYREASETRLVKGKEIRDSIIVINEEASFVLHESGEIEFYNEPTTASIHKNYILSLEGELLDDKNIINLTEQFPHQVPIPVVESLIKKRESRLPVGDEEGKRRKIYKSVDAEEKIKKEKIKKTSVDLLKRGAVTDKVYNLVKQGKTFREIWKELGYNPGECLSRLHHRGLIVIETDTENRRRIYKPVEREEKVKSDKEPVGNKIPEELKVAEVITLPKPGREEQEEILSGTTQIIAGSQRLKEQQVGIGSKKSGETYLRSKAWELYNDIFTKLSKLGDKKQLEKLNYTLRLLRGDIKNMDINLGSLSEKQNEIYKAFWTYFPKVNEVAKEDTEALRFITSVYIYFGGIFPTVLPVSRYNELLSSYEEKIEV